MAFDYLKPYLVDDSYDGLIIEHCASYERVLGHQARKLALFDVLTKLPLETDHGLMVTTVGQTPMDEYTVATCQGKDYQSINKSLPDFVSLCEDRGHGQQVSLPGCFRIDTVNQRFLYNPYGALSTRDSYRMSSHHDIYSFDSNLEAIVREFLKKDYHIVYAVSFESMKGSYIDFDFHIQAGSLFENIVGKTAHQKYVVLGECLDVRSNTMIEPITTLPKDELLSLLKRQRMGERISLDGSIY